MSDQQQLRELWGNELTGVCVCVAKGASTRYAFLAEHGMQLTLKNSFFFTHMKGEEEEGKCL